jgi:hypothetical protein
VWDARHRDIFAALSRIAALYSFAVCGKVGIIGCAPQFALELVMNLDVMNYSTTTYMAIAFTIITVAVILFPIIKLAPSRLARRMNGRVAFHREAIAALTTAIERTDDPEHRERLVSQLAYQRAAFAQIAPADAKAA